MSQNNGLFRDFVFLGLGALVLGGLWLLSGEDDVQEASVEDAGARDVDDLGNSWPSEQARREYIREWKYQEWLGPEYTPHRGSPFAQAGAPGTGKRA